MTSQWLQRPPALPAIAAKRYVELKSRTNNWHLFTSHGSQGARGSAARKHKSPTAASDEVGGTDVQEKHVEELQKRWTGDTHSQGPESPTYCYTLPGSNVCQSLRHQNIAYWALLIVSTYISFINTGPFLTINDRDERSSNLRHEACCCRYSGCEATHTKHRHGHSLL
jgi:hypothetical protein